MPGRPFLKAALVGSFGSMAVMASWAFGEAGTRDLWEWSTLIAGYGLLALPFVALGLAVFGFIPTIILRRRLIRFRYAALALALGYVCGKLAFYLLDQALFFGNYRPLDMSMSDPGGVMGCMAALAWWFFLRRWLMAQDS